jgi:hypothetical protein
MRRRAKARIEKSARVRKLSTITRDFVLPIVNESVVEAEAIGASPVNGGASPGHEKIATAETTGADEPKSIATVWLGEFEWTPPAVERLNRVPEGFMRDITRTKIEEYARQHQLSFITLETAEEGIAVGRQLMAEMIAGYSPAKKEDKQDNGHVGAITSATAGHTTGLNEVPSGQGTVQGTHP